jgi:hypothetical protein
MAKDGVSKVSPTVGVNFRLDREVAQYYKQRANEAGVSLSVFFKNMIVQGLVADNALEIEQRIKGLIANIPTVLPNSAGNGMSDNALLSLYTTQYLLTAIVQARDPQELYAAQDKAAARLKRDKEQS